MYVLGLSGNFSEAEADLVPGLPAWFFHDAAACLIEDGRLVAAVEEERLNRIKHTTKFPINAINAVLSKVDVKPSQIAGVGHYFRQDFVDQMLNELYVDHTQAQTRYSRELTREWFRRAFDWDLPDDQHRYVPHHLAHAGSCFVRSGMPEALVVVMDGRGEEHSGSVYHATPGKLDRLATYDIFKSLGAFYEFSIQLLGYRFGDEYKVMGLAPYGNPEVYRDTFAGFYTLAEHGNYEIQPKSLGFQPVAEPFYSRGLLPRRKGEKFTQQHMDFAAGLQEALERIVLHVLHHWRHATGLTRLCFVGGVAHNSTLNGRILQSGLFDEVYVHPASHDAGSAEGAALEVAYQLGASPFRLPQLRTASVGPSLGTSAAIERKLAAWGSLIEYQRPADVVETAAGLLADGAVLGWAFGDSEFGPRALGNRSILADPRPSENKDRINAMVKKRESYRPFAPVVTAEAAGSYFVLPDVSANYDFMSYVVDVRVERREELGAVTHVDGSARLQIIDPTVNERFHRLVQRFGELTGTPVLLNTSFNNYAEPIVQSVEDVLACLLTTELDAVVVEDFLVRRRSGQAQAISELVLRFRPTTRLTRQVRLDAACTREVVHQVILDYSTGPSQAVSPELFGVLEDADGEATVGALAHRRGGLTAELVAELYELWQARYFTLEPRA